MSDLGEETPGLVSQLAGRTREDPDFACLLDRFVARLQERASAIERTFAEGDYDALVVLAHQLKGTAGGYGFPTIGEAAAGLEASAKARRALDDVADRVRAVAELCRRARAV